MPKKIISALVLTTCLWIGSTIFASSASANNAPTANAGPDQSVQPGNLVTLNGSASTDPEGDPLTYQWSFVVIPAGSALTSGSILDPTSMTPAFTPDSAGSYLLALTVSDAETSVTDTIAVFAGHGQVADGSVFSW